VSSRVVYIFKYPLRTTFLRARGFVVRKHKNRHTPREATSGRVAHEYITIVQIPDRADARPGTRPSVFTVFDVGVEQVGEMCSKE
jgi:hypothetical protein